MSENETITIYGVPLAGAHDEKEGPIPDQLEGYPYQGIIYFGFKAGSSEQRIPTNRIFYFRSSEIKETGELPGYIVDELQVHQFVIPVSTAIFERRFERVNIGSEASVSSSFASRVATPPSGSRVDFSVLDSMSRDELQAMVDAQIRGGGVNPIDPRAGYQLACNSWYQSYRETRYDPFSRSDASGADCD